MAIDPTQQSAARTAAMAIVGEAREEWPAIRAALDAMPASERAALLESWADLIDTAYRAYRVPAPTTRELALAKILRELVELADGASVFGTDVIIDADPDEPAGRRWNEAIAAARRATGQAERGAS